MSTSLDLHRRLAGECPPPVDDGLYVGRQDFHDIGVHTKMSLNVRHRVASPAVSPKELRLSKSGSNSSTRAGYATAANI